MPTSYTGARVTKKFRVRLTEALAASKDKESDVIRAALDEFLKKHNTPTKLHAAVIRSLRRAD